MLVKFHYFDASLWSTRVECANILHFFDTFADCLRGNDKSYRLYYVIARCFGKFQIKEFINDVDFIFREALLEKRLLVQKSIL